MTTPPCTEGVKWLVAADPVFTVTAADFAIIKKKLKYNAREPVPLFNPYDAGWKDVRKSDYTP